MIVLLLARYLVVLLVLAFATAAFVAVVRERG
jgi:hypothetical protein